MRILRNQFYLFFVIISIISVVACKEVLEEDSRSTDTPYGFDIQGVDRMVVGETAQLVLETGSRSAASTLNIEWKSANPKVATVDNKGVVTALSAGKAIISVEDVNFPDNHDVFVIEVEARNFITSLQIEGPHTFAKGQKGQLVAKTLPPEMSNQSLSWKVENDEIAKVDTSGLVIAGNTLGETRIIVEAPTAPDGQKPARAYYPVRVVDFLVASENNQNWLTIGNSIALKASLESTLESIQLGTLTWSSNNPEVVTVSEDGIVTAVSAGAATITAEDTFLGLSATYAVYVVELSITAETHIIETEHTLTLHAGVTPEGSSLTPDVSWVSSDPSLATVVGGVVTAGTEGGFATITAEDKVSGLSSSYDIEVTTIHAESLEITGASEVFVGGETTFDFQIYPAGAVQTEIVWSSLNEQVATVSDKGVVTGVSPGSVKIMAKIGGLDISTTHLVEVLPVVGEGIVITGESQVSIADDLLLEATVFPENATYKDIIWSSSDEKVATVDSSGLVSGEALGTVDIIATLKDNPEVESRISITVAPVLVSSITISGKQEIHKSDSVQLSAKVMPENSTDSGVIWKSSNDLVAKVSKSGEVQGNVVGMATITAESVDGSGVAAEYEVTVYDFVLGKELPRIMVEGDTVQLLPSTIPEQLSVDVDVTWMNKSPRVLSVDQSGLVTAKARGTGTVGALDKITNDQEWTSTTVVGLVIDGSSVSLLERGATKVLTARMLPEGVVDDDISWASSNESIVTVFDNGEVFSKGGFGSAQVVAIDRTTGAQAVHTIVVRDLQVSGADRIKVGETASSRIMANPAKIEGIDLSVRWSSSNPEVASVDPVSGEVTGVSYDVGNPVTITAEDNLGLVASYTIEVAPVPVIMEWNVRSGDTVGLPIRAVGVTLFVDWEDDGSYEEVRTFTDSHEYTSGGKKRIAISANDDLIDLSDWNIAAFSTAQSRFTDVLQWGDAYFKNSNGAFSKAQELVRFSAEDSPILEGSVTKMFAESKQFTGEGIGHWDMSKVTDMNNMFYWTDSFLGEEIGSWDVSSVTDMSYMFRYTSKFVGSELSNWDTSSLENMTWIFAESKAFNGDVGSWDISNVTNMSYSFARSSQFRQDLSSWVVDKNLEMNGVFVGTKMGEWGYIDYHPVNCHKCQAGHWQNI